MMMTVGMVYQVWWKSRGVMRRKATEMRVDEQVMESIGKWKWEVIVNNKSR
jgi:hypothetical protein